MNASVRPRHRRVLVWTLALIFLLACATLWMIGSSLIAVHPRIVTLPDLGGESFSLKASTDQVVAGTYLAGQGPVRGGQSAQAAMGAARCRPCRSV